MNQPKNYEFSFTPDVWPLSFDEVLGERELCIAFDFEPGSDADMIREGIWMGVFARHEGDDEWEEISHLCSKKEHADFVNQCYDYLKETE